MLNIRNRAIAAATAAAIALTTVAITPANAGYRRSYAAGNAAAASVMLGIIGAVVGTQPFGGTGLSGTGPKAGGPNYLRRFTIEQAVTINTAAAGGNASLLATEE